MAAIFRFNMGALSRYRSELMGLATIMILICHASAYGVRWPYNLNKLFVLGNLGVEIFFLVSGIGMSYSLSKISINLLDWYKKRLIRVFIPYIIIAFPWYGIKCVLNHDSLLDFLCNISTMNYWIYHKGAWFIAILLPLYLITPILIKLFYSKYGLTTVIGCIAFSSCCSLIPASGIEGNILWAVHRLPCYFIGLYIAKYTRQERSISFGKICIFAVGLMILLRSIDLSIGWQWPLVLILVPVFCSLLDKYHNISPFYNFFGIISLESYVLNICLGDMIPSFEWDYNGYIRYVLILLIGLCLSYGINRHISNPVINAIHK